MILKSQKRLAAQILKVSQKRIKFDPEKLADIKEAITKADIRSLISEKTITAKPEKGISKCRARKRKVQRRKGRQKGLGTKKGKRTARLPSKRKWINKIRAQRLLIDELKTKKLITPQTYKQIYRKAKGGFFRSRRHINLYLTEHNLITKPKEK